MTDPEAAHYSGDKAHLEQRLGQRLGPPGQSCSLAREPTTTGVKGPERP
jgi:hypothetical protein